jgi:hypothetical protein
LAVSREACRTFSRAADAVSRSWSLTTSSSNVWDASSTHRFQSQAANPPALVRTALPMATKKAVGLKPTSGQSGGLRLSNASSGSDQAGVGAGGGAAVGAVAADVFLVAGVLRGVDGVLAVAAEGGLDDGDAVEPGVEAVDDVELDVELVASLVLDDVASAVVVSAVVASVVVALISAVVTRGSMTSSTGDVGATVVEVVEEEEEDFRDVALLVVDLVSFSDVDFSVVAMTAAVQEGAGGQAHPSTTEAARRSDLPLTSSKV